MQTCKPNPPESYSSTQLNSTQLNSTQLNSSQKTPLSPNMLVLPVSSLKG
jgi:hypothetical protein